MVWFFDRDSHVGLLQALADILQAIAKGYIAVSALSDLYAALDTVDDRILLRCLQ